MKNKMSNVVRCWFKWLAKDDKLAVSKHMLLVLLIKLC